MVVAAGCAGKTSLPPQYRAGTLRSARPATSATPQEALYVVNSEADSVTVYELGSRALTRTLTAPQMLEPTAVAFDTQGNTYVANFGGGPKSIPSGVFVYQPGATLPYRTISAGTSLPIRLAFDSSGNLYVANFGTPASISVYTPGANKPDRTLHNGVTNPVSLAFDSHNNLYVTNHSGAIKDKGYVAVFAPGATRPTRTITQGVHYANQGILDRSGNLYVANDAGGISIYRPGASTPAKIIDRKLPFTAIAFDRGGNLYGLSTSLFVYRAGKSNPFKTISNRDPFSLAIDPNNNVFIGDNPLGCGKTGKRRRLSCVRVFQQGSLAPWYQLRDTDTPSALGFGPP